MTTAKNTRSTQQNKSDGFGLLANGSSGPWEIAIDETTSGTDRWFAQIEGPSISLYFEIPSVGIVDEMLEFLESRVVTPNETPTNSTARHDLLVIGNDKKTPLTLVKDDEYKDRFFFLVGPTGSPIVRLVMASVDVVKIVNALRQIKEDLDDEK